MQKLITAVTVMSTHLRQNSCRVCGLDLEPFRFCSICDQPYQFRCHKCDQYVDEQIHTECKIYKESKKEVSQNV